MSKVDAQRAMREARFTSAPPPRPPRPAVARRGPVPPEAAVAPAVVVDEGPAPATSEKCGHRNMGGKGCQRDAGHAEKNHRYK